MAVKEQQDPVKELRAKLAAAQAELAEAKELLAEWRLCLKAGGFVYEEDQPGMRVTRSMPERSRALDVTAKTAAFLGLTPSGRPVSNGRKEIS